MALRGEAHEVGAARQVVRHRELEVGGPARVVHVVVVEVDGRVLARGVAPAHLAPRPARAGHRARGQVHEPAAEAMRAHVGDREPVDAPGEVPARDQIRGREQRIERPASPARPPPRRAAAGPRSCRCSARARRGPGARRSAAAPPASSRAVGRQGRRRVLPAPAGERGVADAQRARGRVGHEPDPLPLPERQRPGRWSTVIGAPPGAPTRAVTPPGPSDRAQPAWPASSQREITHCSRWAA